MDRRCFGTVNPRMQNFVRYRMIRKVCVAVFPRDKRGTRLRGDHAQNNKPKRDDDSNHRVLAGAHRGADIDRRERGRIAAPAVVNLLERERLLDPDTARHRKAVAIA